ncbi:MAG: PKD domain-containing protein, partial [Bacteroidetes bacterium]|nr:PKD domain-containing protein [Bacteroidota bacterium]
TGTSWYSDMAIDDISVDGGVVSGDDPPVADFSANNLTPTLEEIVSFSDLSTNNPTSFTWSFSPGTITYIAGASSSSQNPQVKFNAPGVYTVSLTVSNSGGSDTKTKTNYINVSILPPVADFSANNLTPTLEEIVSFSDLSTNNPTSCTWSFSPGTITYMGGASSSSQNPQVKFNAPGAYTVSLTVVNSGGTDMKTKTNYITAEIPPPVAGFVADNTAPETNDIVNFTDISNNNPVSWVWVFNPPTVTYMNGTNANSQNPEVRFNIEGYYDVQLTATNASGSDTEFVADYIQCVDPVLPPVADFFANNTSPSPGEIVNFTDVSTNTPTEWIWSFNPPSVTFVNGTTENSQNPQLSFNVAGTYDVTLTSTNSQGTDSEIKIAYIVAADLPSFGLPWSEDFEDVGNTETLTASSVYINGLPEWSYEKTANGRLRFTAGDGFYYSGNHAATVDASPSGISYSLNYLTTTLNLSGYATSANLELSFVYMHHGEESHANDRVWIRGSSSDVWIEAFDLYSNKGTLGTWKTVTGIDIDALLSAHGQCPSSTFQLRFGQEDNYAASRTTASDGFTFDDIKVEEMEVGAYTINEFPYAQSWESGMGLWMQGSSDDFDWTRLNRGTPSSLTGPTGAQAGNYYLYTEASSPRVNGDEAHLEATFDFTTLPVPTLSFYYHMYGISIASLHVDVFDGSWHNSVWVANGPQQNTQSDPYEQAVIDLSAWGGEDNIVIRFRGIVGSGAAATFYSDIAIDMLEVVGGIVSEDPPVADFLADNTNPSMGEIVTITDISTNSPTAWLWSFDPPSVTFVDGTSATSQNPKLIFEVAGAYDVTLTATNANGADSETKLTYITAFDLPFFSLPWIEDFEDIGSIETFAANTTTIEGLPEWAYEKTATGRLRFAAGSGFYNSGNHAATVDANPSGSSYAVNYIIATLDLSAYALSADLELAFEFMHHGEESNANDRVWIRGSSSDIWIEAFNLYTNRGTVGRWNTISGIDIDALLSANNQSPSSTFQVRFGQEDNYSAFRTTSSDGFTFDDIMVSGTIQSLQNVSTGSGEASQVVFMFADESDIEKLIEVYPNPAKDQLNIVSASTDRMEILIYSLTGQLVYYKNDVDNYELIDIINYDRGMYVVKIRTDGQVINKKIVKQ